MSRTPADLLRNAERAWDNADKATAEQLCKKILDTHPESREAKEAKAILDGMAMPIVQNGPTPHFVDSDTASSKYSVARGSALLIEIVGWAAVVIGIVIMISMAAKQQGILGVLIGAALAIVGFAQIAGAQIVKATVDTADNTRSILTELRKQAARK